MENSLKQLISVENQNISEQELLENFNYLICFVKSCMK